VGFFFGSGFWGHGNRGSGWRDWDVRPGESKGKRVMFVWGFTTVVLLIYLEGR
jgi:hypothetical protein